MSSWSSEVVPVDVEVVLWILRLVVMVHMVFVVVLIVVSLN